jgi:hypothetical protein
MIRFNCNIKTQQVSYVICTPEGHYITETDNLLEAISLLH